MENHYWTCMQIHYSRFNINYFIVLSRSNNGVISIRNKLYYRIIIHLFVIKGIRELASYAKVGLLSSINVPTDVAEEVPSTTIRKLKNVLINQSQRSGKNTL